MKQILILLILMPYSCIADNNKTSLISIPKCGNFLLLKLMQMISKKELVVSTPVNTDLDWSNHFTLTHSIITPEIINFCRKNNIKVVFIYRDPRDQVVSAAYYLKKLKINSAKDLSISEIITSLINNSFDWWRVINIPAKNGTVADFFQLMMQWAQQDFVYATTFEKIIGPQGGGDQTTQLEEIKKIAEFCGYFLDDEEVAKIADSLWGNRNTFREGKIGSWKKEFTPDQKNLFKSIAGQLLIDLGYEKDLNW